ncbi:MAG: N-acetylglucosamine-6-phosphate deacetylase [Alkalilacustris sp.]
MPRTLLTGATPFDGLRLRPGMAVAVEDGRVAGLIPDPGPDIPAGTTVERLPGGILAPGFLDLQVNGGGGVMLNGDPTPATMARIAGAHRAFGTTAILPTLITADPETTRTALAAAAHAPPGVLGLHLEGPHLAPARCGAHDDALMRPLTEADVALYAEARRHVPRLLVTLAPEMAPPTLIGRLTAAGVTVALGHSNCSAAEADAAFDAGATGVTHLFNAMSGLDHRGPGLAAAALTRSGVWGGIIADGHHVDARLLRIALAAKSGPGRLYLVTDAMAPVGAASAGFALNGRPVRRIAVPGAPDRLELPDGTLAGAALDMATAVRFTADRLGQGSAGALRRATADPAAFLGLPRHGRLRPGARADLVHLSDDLQVLRVWCGGEP